MKKLLTLLTFLSLPVWSADHIRIYILPPVVPLDWSTPRSLFKSAFKNRWDGGERPYGHVYTEVNCEKTKFVATTSSKNFNPVSEFIRGGRGLGILYHTYEGQLETGPALEKELASRKAEGKMLFIDYQINEGQCARMATYLDEYKRLNVGRAYGLPHRPLYGEGGLDSAFAVSFLDVAGILNEREREEWWNQVNIPLDYSGPPIKDDTVNFIRVLFGASDWATESTPHKKLQFYDPQKMVNWIVREKTASRLICEDKGNGVCLNASHLPAKQGPIWMQHTDPIYQKAPVQK